MIHLTPTELRIVRNILRSTVPKAKVAVFGSRATGIRLKKFSDLDLLIQASRTLSFATSAKIKEAFSESDLVFRVDIVDARTASKSFLEHIQKDLISIQK